MMQATKTLEDMEAEPEFVDGADGYSMEAIMGASDGHAFTYDDLIMLPGFIDFGVADVRRLVSRQRLRLRQQRHVESIAACHKTCSLITGVVGMA